MPPRKSDNAAERIERLNARLAQLHAEGQRAIEKSREARDKADALLSKVRRLPKPAKVS